MRKGFAILDLPLASAILGQDLDGQTLGYRIYEPKPMRFPCARPVECKIPYPID
jgi:hypothetical protein